jgi:hypothetical protein
MLEILATAAMYHPDVLSGIEASLSQQQDIESHKGSVLFGHLIAISKENVPRMAPPAHVTQYPQPRYSQTQYPPRYSQVQQPQLQEYPPQHPPPYGRQPGCDRRPYKRDGDYESEESDEDEESDDESDTAVLGFEARANRVSYILYTKHSHLRDSQQAHITWDAAHGIIQHIQKIADVTRPDSPYVTKDNAMYAYHKIGMTVAEADGYLGNEVKNHLASDPVFVQALQSLYDGMTAVERERISHDHLDDLEQLDKSRDFCFEGFDDIVKQFREACPPRQGEEGIRKSVIASIDLAG